MKLCIRRLFLIALAVVFILSASLTIGESSVWDCPECGRTGNTGNFCGGCGHPAPWTEGTAEDDLSAPAAEKKVESGASDGYPAIIEGLDFGGKDVYIYDWYSTGTRSKNPTEEEQLTYDYRDWLNRTYNVNVIEIALSDWEGQAGELQNFVMNNNPDGRLAIFGLSCGFAGPAVRNDLYMPWTYALDTGMYNKMTVDFMTRDGVCYGVPGGSNVEPRQVVFFNKKVLENAGIKWEELYDLQKNMEWTWDKFERYMDIINEGADTNGDGEADVWALTGNGDDVTVALVVSNEADFFKMDETGKLVPAIRDQEFLDAIQRRQDWDSKYMRPSEQWDDYQRFWPEGNVAFLIGQAYEGFNADSLVSQIGDWGCVAVPMGPNARRYTSAADNNVFGIPNVYDEETSLKLQQIYTLYRMPAPGTVEETAEGEENLSWATRYYSRGCDDRAIEETYAMLRKVENATIMNFNKIGDRNSSITEVTWQLGSGTPAEIAEAAWGPFQQRCDVYNGV